MKIFKTAVIATSLILMGSAASAHPRPKSAVPKPNAVLTASPVEIRIGFSEGLVSAFSSMDIKNSAGQKIDEDAASVDPKDEKVLIMPISHPLPAETYTVTWHVVGDDTHHVSGHYSFQVKP